MDTKRQVQVLPLVPSLRANCFQLASRAKVSMMCVGGLSPLTGSLLTPTGDQLQSWPGALNIFKLKALSGRMDNMA